MTTPGPALCTNGIPPHLLSPDSLFVAYEIFGIGSLTAASEREMKVDVLAISIHDVVAQAYLRTKGAMTFDMFRLVIVKILKIIILQCFPDTKGKRVVIAFNGTPQSAALPVLAREYATQVSQKSWGLFDVPGLENCEYLQRAVLTMLRNTPGLPEDIVLLPWKMKGDALYKIRTHLTKEVYADQRIMLYGRSNQHCLTQVGLILRGFKVDLMYIPQEESPQIVPWAKIADLGQYDNADTKHFGNFLKKLIIFDNSVVPFPHPKNFSINPEEAVNDYYSRVLSYREVAPLSFEALKEKHREKQADLNWQLDKTATRTYVRLLYEQFYYYFNEKCNPTSIYMYPDLPSTIGKKPTLDRDSIKELETLSHAEVLLLTVPRHDNVQGYVNPVVYTRIADIRNKANFYGYVPFQEAIPHMNAEVLQYMDILSEKLPIILQGGSVTRLETKSPSTLNASTAVKAINERAVPVLPL